MVHRRDSMHRWSDGSEEIPLSLMGYMTPYTTLEPGVLHEALEQMRQDSLMEQSMKDAAEGGEQNSSRPPSPPDSRPSTPRVTIQPCPQRLRPLVPARNYGAVERATIFRSGFPEENNVTFIEELKLRGIITLVSEPMRPQMQRLIDRYGIKHACVPIQANKEQVIKTTLDSLCEALLFVMNPENHPVYIHCNRGKHRTGCVVACLRKCQAWPMDEILAEYETYADGKDRAEDKAVMQAFKPDDVFKYAKKHNLLASWPRVGRKDSFMDYDPADVYDLASSLPAHNMALIDFEDGESDDEEHDVGVEIAYRTVKKNAEKKGKEAVADMDTHMFEDKTWAHEEEEALHVEETDLVE